MYVCLDDIQKLTEIKIDVPLKDGKPLVTFSKFIRLF